MFQVSTQEDRTPSRLTRYAASKCYNRNSEECLKNCDKIDIPNALGKTGHHTTLQHSSNYISFDIENIPVSLATFGLHLTHPFYNSSQRSGRYCLDMFDGDNRIQLVEYIQQFKKKYIGDTPYDLKILNWFLRGFDFFHDNIDKVQALAKDALYKERPHYKLDIERQSLRIAQDQLRVFISTIVPTGMVYTINHIALFALYASAWNDPLKDLTQQMIHQIEDLDIIRTFDSLNLKQTNDYHPHFECYGDENKVFGILNKPEVNVHLTKIINDDNFDKFESLFKSHAVLDTLYFDPNCYPEDIDDLYCTEFKATVKVPVVTFGQDQRHRMISRTLAKVTGDFYISPLLEKVPGVIDFAARFANEYNELVNNVGPRNMIHFIPYGSVVEYAKRYDYRAYAHCIHKRMCFNAEATIWKMENETIRQLFALMNRDRKESVIGPPCLNGKCPEGKRSCGKERSCLTRNLI
jgi:hypothetical protein